MFPCAQIVINYQSSLISYSKVTGKYSEECRITANNHKNRHIMAVWDTDVILHHSSNMKKTFRIEVT